MKSKVRILVLNDEPACVVESLSGTDGMLGFLDEPGGPFMVPRIGQEVVVGRRPVKHLVIDVTRGETYPSPDGGSTTGGRYLMRSNDGVIIGALNYTVRKTAARQQVVLSNLAVAKNSRRQGVATQLLAELVNDYPSVRADSNMTGDGAAFLGYEKPAPTTAARFRP